MNKRIRVTIAAVAIAVVSFGIWRLLNPGVSDATQIKLALKNALAASRDARPGGVIEYLASDVVLNGQTYNVNRQFTDFIRRYHPDIEVGSIDPKISGDTATVTSDVQFSVLNNTLSLPSVTFQFKKLNDTKWLVFPSHDWKVTGATAPPEAYEQLLGQLAADGDFAPGGGLW